MAQLTASDALKTFYRGPLQGQERYKMIAKKLKNEEPFKFFKKGFESVKLVDPALLKILEGDDLEKVNGLLAGSSKPFMLANVEGTKPFGIRRFDKTEEFGGGSSQGKQLDPHELMTAALILKYGSEGIRAVPPSAYSDLNKAKNALNLLKTTANSIVYTSGNKSELIKAFTGEYGNYGKAISAANGFLRALGQGSKVHRVHATGQQWLTILSKYFAVNKHKYFGKKDYNSSDLIVEVHRQDKIKLFVGISLKKKGAGANEPSPTIINKTVVGEDGILTFIVGEPALQTRMKDALGRVYQARSQFFYDVIASSLSSEDPTTQKYTLKKLFIKDGEDQVPPVKASSTMKTGSQIYKKAEEDRAKKVVEQKNKNIEEYLANLKKSISTNRSVGQNVLKQAQKLGQKEAVTPAMSGKWPPKKPVFNQYFKELNDLIISPAVMRPLCIGLLNIIFKLDLKRMIKDRSRYSEEFAFTLITGAGDLGDGGIIVKPPTVIPEAASTSKILEETTNPRATYVLQKPAGYTQAFERGASGAKLKYDLLLNGINIALLEIRYKGSIVPEPQFQAYITPSFEKLLQAKDMPKAVY